MYAYWRFYEYYAHLICCCFFMDFFLFLPALVKIHVFFILYPVMFLLSSYIHVFSTAIVQECLLQRLEVSAKKECELA